MLPGERTAESWHDLLRRMSRRWRPGFGRPAAIRMPDVVGRLRCRCWPGSTATVPRAGRGADDGNSVATPFCFHRRGQDHPRRLLRHFAHPHVRGTPPSPSPPVSKPFPLWGVPPVPFCSSPPPRSAWATKGFFFFQSPSSSPEMPPPWSRINTGAVRVPPTQPKGGASGPTLRTTGSVALVRANHGPLFTSSPARFIRSRPPSAPQPHAAAGSSAMAASGAPLNTGPGAWQRRRMKDSRSWRRVQPGTLASWADKAAWSEWVGAGVGVDRGKEQGDKVERASHKMA